MQIGDLFIYLALATRAVPLLTGRQNMISRIQITQPASSTGWLADSEKAQARRICAKAGYSEDPLVAAGDLQQIEYREIPLDLKPQVRV